MSAAPDWKASLKLFFADRASEIADVPTHEDLCYISGREPRLWSQKDVYDDMIGSILALTGAGAASTVLEVGCAAGFIAKGIAPRVARYTGVDLARPALDVARKLHLPNAIFEHSAGERLRFPDRSFDAAFCYDVFTNFPSFDDGAALIRELYRVVRPGGRALVGSIPDGSKQAAFEQRVAEVVQDLDARFGTLKPRPEAPRRKAASITNALRRLTFWRPAAQPLIVCYYFSADDFMKLGKSLGTQTRIVDIHRLNPYAGFRFNAVLTKPGA